MSAPAYRLRPVDSVAVEDGFWDHPRSAAEIRERLRSALADEIGDRAERIRRRIFDALGTEPTRRSTADLLFLVDELVAQVRREERAGRNLQ